GSELARRVAAARVPVQEVLWPIGLDPRAWWRLFLHVKAFQPAIIHAHDGHALGIATWAGAWLKHDAAAPRLIATRRVVFAVRRASALYRADYIVAISEAVKAALVGAGVPPAEIGVVRSGIDPDEVRAAAAVPFGLRTRLGLPPGTPIAVNVAALEPAKDQATLVRAAQTARALRPAPWDRTRRMAGARWGCGRPRGQGRAGTGSPVPVSPSPAVHRRCDGPRRLGRVSLARLDCRAMIYVCVPAHNEARTVGLVLWKVRQVFTAFPREYQLLVADDGSSDGTGVVLASYAKVLPLTVVTHRERQGYAKSLEELLRLALQRTDHPKRDCAITLHADFVHSPESMEEMVKRIESGADLIVAEQRDERGRSPRAVRLARRWTPRLLPVPGVKDTVSGFCALRLIVLRQALGVGGGRDATPLLSTDGRCRSAELIARPAPHARRVDAIPAAARYDLVQRPSRVKPWRQLLDAWRARTVIRAARTSVVALLCLAGGLTGQSDSTRRDSARVDSGRSAASIAIGAVASAVPFPVGERLVYQAKFGLFNVGTATMEVAGLDTVRGTETVHLVFSISGGALWYHIEQQLESWVGGGAFRSG